MRERRFSRPLRAGARTCNIPLARHGAKPAPETRHPMPEAFADKLAFVMKALSLTRGGLAVEMEVDKSIVGRWVRGTVMPSAHSLSRLTALVATKVGTFSLLDWERDLDDLAGLIGVAPSAAPSGRTAHLPPGLPIMLMDQILDTTARRAPAYEGFFRSTRPYPQKPGRFIHDQIMLRRDDTGLLRLDMTTGGVLVRGWVLLLQNQLFVVASELTSGALAFAILNGVNTLRAGAIDGILLHCSLDASRSPTASFVIIERISDLTGDHDADDHHFAKLFDLDHVAPEGSVPGDLAAHLVRDVGPAQLAIGGDWLLTLPLARSLSGGLREA